MNAPSERAVGVRKKMARAAVPALVDAADLVSRHRLFPACGDDASVPCCSTTGRRLVFIVENLSRYSGSCDGRPADWGRNTEAAA